MPFSFTVPAGSKVLSEKRGMVTLQAPAFIDGATRQDDGGYIYTVGGERYYTCAGILENVRHVDPATADEWEEMTRHRDGLVWFA